MVLASFATRVVLLRDDFSRVGGPVVHAGRIAGKCVLPELPLLLTVNTDRITRVVAPGVTHVF